MRARAAILLLVALVLPGCASDAPAADAVEFPDVHGVAIDPLDPAFVYVATHVGLFRGNEDGWARVGETRNDLMGFSVAPDGRALFASGHPPGGGNLGLQRSDDAGATWRQVGAPNADFHAMTVSPADPTRLYGFYRGALYASDDAGANWSEHAKIAVSALAAHPTDPDTVYAATTASVGRSDNAGRGWTPLVDAPAYGVAVGDALYLSGKDLVQRSDDNGRTWTTITPEATGTFSALSTRGASVVVASYEGAVLRSDDEGATWRELHAPSR